jgi:DNA-binding MarR family transcriptional regulator
VPNSSDREAELGAGRVDFDDVVHQQVRLRLLVVLNEVRETDFSYLKSNLYLTDGNLGRHIEILARSNFVRVRKTHLGGKPRTLISITRRGRNALLSEIKSLKSLLGL